MPKGKQFDFSETQIFGKFDLFCRRLIKLMDMFSTMQQFKALEQHRFEGLDPLITTFNEVVANFRAKGHDLLDFHLNKFDRDYVDFNVRMTELGNAIYKYYLYYIYMFIINIYILIIFISNVNFIYNINNIIRNNSSTIHQSFF